MPTTANKEEISLLISIKIFDMFFFSSTLAHFQLTNSKAAYVGENPTNEVNFGSYPNFLISLARPFSTFSHDHKIF